MREKFKNLFYSLITLYFSIVLLRWVKLEVKGINRESLLKLSLCFGVLLILMYKQEIWGKLKIYLDQNKLKKNEREFRKPFKVVNRKVQFLFSTKIFKFLIPLILFFLGIEITLASLSTSGEKLHILFQNLPISSIDATKTGELYTGDRISGEFIAKENNLGTFGLNFDTFDRQNTGTIMFKIREKEKESWLYSNEYPLSKIAPKENFPFGFPKIPDSKGKSFVWEIISVDGKPGNAVGLNQTDYPIKVKYEFDKLSIIKNPLNFLIFFDSKIKNLLLEFNYLPYLIIYFSPLFFYLSGIFLIQYNFARYLYQLIILLFVIVEIFIIKLNNDYIFFTISLLWLATNLVFEYSGKISVTVGLFFLMFIPIYLINENEIMAEKFGIWAYLFFLCGTIILMIRKDQNNQAGDEK